ncbi:MAG: hypothetical protein MUE32_06130 [Bacteroidales bacterium]|nr:hypothetical protein [Bacteroidales bacterium]
MKKSIFLLLLTGAGFLSLHSQTPDPSWGIKFSGFVKNDIFYDTRQSGASNGIREGHFYLYPDNVLNDSEGNDLNANPSFHMLSIQTRLKGDISGPDAFGAKTSGVIEAEFFGTSESDINGFRLRHAYVKLDWAKSSLLAGQYWHPLFPTESFPGTVSFNTGAPFTPFSRNPQVRFTAVFGKVSAIATAYAQRDFVSSGPDGGSNKYMRNSGLPGFNGQVRVAAGEKVTAWAGFDYKNLRPELRTSLNVETNERIGSIAAFANVKFKTTPFTLSVMGIWAQNASDLVMIGGYAVTGTADPVSGAREYTNYSTLNGWADISTNAKKVNAGLFAGYSRNLGASDDVTGSFYGRGNNISHIFRISPRVTVTEGRFTVSAEIESTTAAYGTAGSDGLVTNAEGVSNLRILLATIFRF